MGREDSPTFDELFAVNRVFQTGEPPTDPRVAHLVVQRAEAMKRTFPQGWKGFLLPLGIALLCLALLIVSVVDQRPSRTIAWAGGLIISTLWLTHWRQRRDRVRTIAARAERAARHCLGDAQDEV